MLGKSWEGEFDWTLASEFRCSTQAPSGLYDSQQSGSPRCQRHPNADTLHSSGERKFLPVVCRRHSYVVSAGPTWCSKGLKGIRVRDKADVPEDFSWAG